MSIVTESYVPKLILQLNSVQKKVNYRGIEREITETYWIDHIGPLLYPNWDTDKDKLIQLNYYDTGAFHAKRRKFVRNHSTGQYEWKDYEMQTANNINEASVIFDKLKEAFYLMDSVEKDRFQKELSDSYYMSSKVSWHSIRLARNFLLSDCDWVFTSDSPITDPEEIKNWKKYRQELRNIPQNEKYAEPIDVRFPISPMDWKHFYEKSEGEIYLGTLDQYLKLAAYYVTHFKERIYQYLIVRNSVMSPMNYRNYTDRLGTTQFFPEGSATASNSEEFVDELLNYVSEGGGSES